MFGIISYLVIAVPFLAPMPATLKKEACTMITSDKVSIYDKSVTIIELDNEIEYSSVEFINGAGESMETWPMFGSVDYFQWDMSMFEEENIWIVFRNKAHQACQATQVK